MERIFVSLMDFGAQVQRVEGKTKLLQVASQVVVIVVGLRLITLYSVTRIKLGQQKNS
jgi:hypothetical protein